MQTSTRYRIHPLTAALLVGLGLGAAATGALAASRIPVTTTGDAGTAATCTLRQAIVAMNNAGSTTGTACVASTISGSTDTIVFDTTTFPPNGANVITLADTANNQLSVTNTHLAIDASANGNVTVQRSATATNAFGILYDTTYGALTINSLTIANGKLTAAQPSHYAFGAGISCVCSSLSLSNSTVTGNAIAAAAYSAGGGVFVYSGDLVLTNSTVSNNSVSGNSGASGMGGGIFVRPNIYTHVGGDATISDSQITGNSAQGNGGGLHIGGTLVMSNSTVSGNTALNNGGGMKVYGVTTLTNSAVSGNTASNSGGGVYDGSGFYGVPSALITFNYSTLSGNRITNPSGGHGGGLFTRVGNLAFSNSTISGNSAANGSGFGGGYGFGGGIYVKQNDDPITMQQTTLAGNTAGKRGGGLMIMTSGAGTVTFNGTLFSNTVAPSSGGGNIGVTTGGITIAGSNNLVYPGVSITGDTINAAFANAPLTGDPKLTELANFGGTTETMAPLPGSAAIDAFAPVAGSCPVARDQRYLLRPQGAGCDIGAVESDVIFRNGFESSPLPQSITQCTGATGYSDVLIEDFPGTNLSSNWTTNNNGGTVAVNNGISLSSSATQFPFITSATPIIPATGDFSVRWQAMFTTLSGHGTGTLVLSNGLPAYGVNDNYNLRSADAWQDTSNGFTVRARDAVGNYNSVFAQAASTTTSHDIEYCWIGSNVEIWVDGARQTQVANATLTRPTSLWFGNPAVSGASAWSSFTLNHVYVRSVTP